MNGVAWLIIICVTWGWIVGFYTGKAQGRDEIRARHNKF